MIQKNIQICILQHKEEEYSKQVDCTRHQRGKRQVKLDFAHNLQKDTVVGCTGFIFDRAKGKTLIL